MTTAEKDLLVSRIYLRAVLPAAKVLVSDVPELAKSFAGMNATVQFAARSDQGPVGAYFKFEDGRVEVIQGVLDNPTLRFGFGSVAQMNAFFGGKISLPSIRGWTHFGLLVKVMRLLLSLKILMPDADPKTPDRRRLKCKMLLHMIAPALSQLNKGGDPDMKRYTSRMPDRIFQWSIEPDGIASYLRVKAGQSKAGLGYYTRKRPIVHMKFQGVEGAYPVLTSRIDVVEAIIKEKVVVEGSPEYAKDIGVFMKRVESLIA